MNRAQSFHLAFCVDDNYLRPMGATVMSILDHNPDRHFTVHVLVFSVSDDNRRRLQQLDGHPQVTVRLHIVDPAAFASLSHYIANSYYSLSVFARLVIPDLLKGETERVTYLDADILCAGSVDELAAMDVSNDIALTVLDAPITVARRCKALGLQHGKYFNAGFMHINLPNWIAQGISEQAFEMLAKPQGDMRFQEQDALNRLLDGRSRYIDGKYNFIYDMVYDLDRGISEMRPVGDAVFLHFAGAVKPWAEWSEHAARAMFRKYHARSPWSDMPLDAAPRNTREMRLQSRFMAKRGRLAAALGWYLRYLRARA